MSLSLVDPWVAPKTFDVNRFLTALIQGCAEDLQDLQDCSFLIRPSGLLFYLRVPVTENLAILRPVATRRLDRHRVDDLPT